MGLLSGVMGIWNQGIVHCQSILKGKMPFPVFPGCPWTDSAESSLLLLLLGGSWRARAVLDHAGRSDRGALGVSACSLYLVASRRDSEGPWNNLLFSSCEVSPNNPEKSCSLSPSSPVKCLGFIFTTPLTCTGCSFWVFPMPSTVVTATWCKEQMGAKQALTEK